MESFFLAETTKYLYLLFDTDNFIHNQGEHGTVIDTPNGECVIEAGGYVFNTEAHPIDPSALYCCHEVPHQRLFDYENLKPNDQTLRGDRIKPREIKKPEPGNIVTETAAAIRTEDGVTIQVSIEVTSEFKIGEGDNLFAQIEGSGNEIDNISGGQKSIADNSKFLNIIRNVTPNPPKQLFDAQKMLERFRDDNKYPINSSWENNYEMLSCQAQPFMQKMSLYGEFFDK